MGDNLLDKIYAGESVDESVQETQQPGGGRSVRKFSSITEHPQAKMWEAIAVDTYDPTKKASVLGNIPDHVLAKFKTIMELVNGVDGLDALIADLTPPPFTQDSMDDVESPENLKYIAMDSDGNWFAYSEQPTHTGDIYVWSDAGGDCVSPNGDAPEGFVNVFKHTLHKIQTPVVGEPIKIETPDGVFTIPPPSKPQDNILLPRWEDAPEWAQWIAMDSDGAWYWYREKPRTQSTSWILKVNSSPDNAMNRVNFPDSIWKNSLTKRPNNITVLPQPVAVAHSLETFRSTPQWNELPNKAQWVTMDMDGEWRWFSVKPTPLDSCWGVDDYTADNGNYKHRHWKTVIFERPKS